MHLFAIDPHDGVISSLDQGVTQTRPTFETFTQNIREAGIEDIVEPIVAHSIEVTWNKPISLLLIDGLHDYHSVAQDFHQFSDWIRLGGAVAFHDYADYFQGVKKFVDELIGQGQYKFSKEAKSLLVLEKSL